MPPRGGGEEVRNETVLPCAVILVVVLFGVPGYAAERLVPYDDFNARYINPDRWWGGNTAQPPHVGRRGHPADAGQPAAPDVPQFGPKNSNSGMIRNEFVLMFAIPIW